QPSAPAPQIAIDSHDDKAWRDTLLKVAAILCERQPDSPQGYRSAASRPCPAKQALAACDSSPICATGATLPSGEAASHCFVC
ncbi:hypothetical protein MMT22_29240, partial [Escherichia coli]|nr:hypothetical protein [Escherichia coli]